LMDGTVYAHRVLNLIEKFFEWAATK